MTFSADQLAIIRRLAMEIRHSKAAQKISAREDAAAVLAILDAPPSRNVVVATLEKPEDKRCRLAVGEVCMFCNSVGRAKVKAKTAPVCYVCQKPFTRATGAEPHGRENPWRLLRGRRVHIACIHSK